MAKAKGNGLTRYTTYNFSEQDPILDVYEALRRKSGLSDKEIADRSKLSRSTLRNWKRKKTKRPQFATVAAAAVVTGADSLPLTAEARQKFKGR